MDRFSWLALLNAEIGDIIEIQRKGFSHWGIYAGKDKNDREWVYNMQVYPPQNKNANGKVSAVKCELDKVLEGDLCRLNNFQNHFCTKGKSPQDPNDVIKEATAMIAQDFKYELEKWNAEYYVTQCKFGRGSGFSGQAIESILAPKKIKLGKRLCAKRMIKKERKRLAQELYGVGLPKGAPMPKMPEPIPQSKTEVPQQKAPAAPQQKQPEPVAPQQKQQAAPQNPQKAPAAPQQKQPEPVAPQQKAPEAPRVPSPKPAEVPQQKQSEAPQQKAPAVPPQKAPEVPSPKAEVPPPIKLEAPPQKPVEVPPPKKPEAPRAPPPKPAEAPPPKKPEVPPPKETKPTPPKKPDAPPKEPKPPKKTDDKKAPAKGEKAPKAPAKAKK